MQSPGLVTVIKTLAPTFHKQLAHRHMSSCDSSLAVGCWWLRRWRHCVA